MKNQYSITGGNYSKIRALKYSIKTSSIEYSTMKSLHWIWRKGNTKIEIPILFQDFKTNWRKTLKLKMLLLKIKNDKRTIIFDTVILLLDYQFFRDSHNVASIICFLITGNKAAGAQTTAFNNVSYTMRLLHN